MRTTIDISPPLMSELKRLQRRTHRPLSSLVNELLATGLSVGVANDETLETVDRWVARSMGRPRVNLLDKEALRRALEDSR